jgi:hypothetical protein
MAATAAVKIQQHGNRASTTIQCWYRANTSRLKHKKLHQLTRGASTHAKLRKSSACVLQHWWRIMIRGNEVCDNAGDISAREDTTTQIRESIFPNVNFLKGLNGIGIQRDGIVPAPTTVSAARSAAKAEYAAATMEYDLAQLRLERAQLQLDQANNEFASFHSSETSELIVDTNSTVHDAY